MLTSEDRFSGSMIATAVSRSLLTRISADYERDEYLMDEEVYECSGTFLDI